MQIKEQFLLTTLQNSFRENFFYKAFQYSLEEKNAVPDIIEI